jgi:integrase
MTVTHHRSILRRVLNLAVHDGVIARNPVAGTRIRRTEVAEERPLDPDQVLTLLAAARETMWHTPLTVAVSTGLRPGELLGLTWADVNLEARTLRVRQAVERFDGSLHVTGVKTQRSRRTIPLSGLAVVALNEQRTRAGAVLPTAYVLPSTSGGPIEPRNLTRAFKKVAARAGLPRETRLYDLRHACASLLLAAGEHPRVVADLLGHSTTRLTMDSYSHVLPTLARSAADRLDAILTSGRLQ